MNTCESGSNRDNAKSESEDGMNYYNVESRSGDENTYSD